MHHEELTCCSIWPAFAESEDASCPWRAAKWVQIVLDLWQEAFVRAVQPAVACMACWMQRICGLMTRSRSRMLAWHGIHIYIYIYTHTHTHIYTYISCIRCLGAVSVGMRRTDTCLRIAYRSERARAFLEVCAELHGRWGVLRMARVGMGSLHHRRNQRPARSIGSLGKMLCC